MSKREVESPDQHGWEIDGDRWVWAGTSTSAGKWEDGPDDSIYYDKGNVGVGIAPNPSAGSLLVNVGTDLNIAMNSVGYAGVQKARLSAFDDAVSAGIPLAIEGSELILRTGGDDSLTIDATGKVGIGTDSPNRILTVQSDQQATSSFVSTSGVKATIQISNANSTSSGNQWIGTEGTDLRLATGNSTRMAIDAAGDATFSGDVAASSFLCEKNGVIKFADAGNQRISRIYNDGASSTSRMAFDIQDSNGWIRALDIAADGNATFGAAVTSDSVKTNSVHSGVSGRAGVLFGSSAQVLPCDHNGNPVDDTADLGRKSDRFRQGWFSNAVSGSAFKTFNVDDGSDVLTIFGRTIYAEDGNGFYFPSGGTNTILPCRSSDGDTTDGVVTLGNNIKRFKNLFLSGSVLPGGYLYQNGGEVVLSVDVLLDAFKELRTATADESSVETLRDAMSNCLGGLIERLEGIKHDADAAREEMIEDVSMPEVGTMDIQ